MKIAAFMGQTEEDEGTRGKKPLSRRFKDERWISRGVRVSTMSHWRKHFCCLFYGQRKTDESEVHNDAPGDVVRLGLDQVRLGLTRLG